SSSSFCGGGRPAGLERRAICPLLNPATGNLSTSGPVPVDREPLRADCLGRRLKSHRSRDRLGNSHNRRTRGRNHRSGCVPFGRRAYLGGGTFQGRTSELTPTSRFRGSSPTWASPSRRE